MKRRSGGGYKKFSLGKFFFELLRSVFQFVWKGLPYGSAFIIFYFAFFGTHHLLHADSYFHVTVLKVFPKGILTSEEYSMLERKCRDANILDFDLTRLSNFIKTDPRVKQVTVYRHLPNELEVFMVPRKPLAQLHFSPKGDFYTIDEEGIVMEKTRFPTSGLIVLNHYDYPRKNLNMFDQYQFDAFRKFPNIISALKQNEVTKSESISEMSVDHLGNYSIFLTNGPELRICQDAAENLRKLNVMNHLIVTNEREKIEYIDLCLDNVVVQPVSTFAKEKHKAKKSNL